MFNYMKQVLAKSKMNDNEKVTIGKPTNGNYI